MRSASGLPNLILTLPIFLLLSLGILVIYSSDPKLAVGQTVFAILGLVIYWLLSLIDFESYNDFVKYLYFGVVFLLLIVFILGIETRGSLRWIPLGLFQLQPSEFAKPILILFLAKFWNEHISSWRNILLSFLWLLPVAGLVFKQPDLGTTLTILAIWLFMLIGANVSWIKLLVMGLSTAFLVPITWMLLRDYQKSRILSFLSPAQDPLGVGYNVIQAMIAVGSGQILGRGLGRGTQSRLQFLPEFRTDFIFASIAEEFGFLGSIIVLGLYGVIIIQSFKIMSKLKSRFSLLLVYGVLGMIFFQITVNVGMNVGLVPVTGITLPLISYGGSSVISTLIGLSFIASAARFSHPGLSEDQLS